MLCPGTAFRFATLRFHGKRSSVRFSTAGRDQLERCAATVARQTLSAVKGMSM